jgi:hypothetical protein
MEGDGDAAATTIDRRTAAALLWTKRLHFSGFSEPLPRLEDE